MAGQHLSKDFFDLVKSIGEAKSKQEEDRIIIQETGVLKKAIGDRALVGKRLKEFLIRVMYVEMLGHDASFGYMKAVELSASANLLEKRVAYLCAGLCFAPEHEFRMMLVNRLQRDLQSANVLECAIALSAAAKILTGDMIPAVLPIVSNLLKHDQEIVRKKAVMLLHRFHILNPESVTDMNDKFRRALCDKDPSVMGASLHIFFELLKTDATPYKDLVSSFVSILKQISEKKLPKDFEYHRVCAPWMQLKLLRILSILGCADQSASEQMYEVLLDVMRRGDTGNNVGYAVIYECVRTVTSIYPNTALLDAAAASIARFISSDNHNLKYLGVTGLASIVKDHPRYAAEHQLAVIDCLEDPDDTLKRKTLDLLYRMTNPVNVEFITAKLLEHLKGATDAFLRSDLVSRITAAAERFAPSNSWYIATMTEVFELGGELVRPEVAANLIRLIAEGTGESDAADMDLRREAVETLLTRIDRPSLADLLLQTMFWILGEYGSLATSCSLEAVLDKVCMLAGRAGLDPTTRGYGLSAVAKLAAQLGGLSLAAQTLMGKLSVSKTADLAQRCAEVNALAPKPALMRIVLPLDASTEDIHIDTDMHFLDAFVQDALSAGARPYAPPQPEEGEAVAAAETGGGLRFDAYERTDNTTFLPTDDTTQQAAVGGAGAFDAAMASGSAGGLNLSAVKGVWGREGYKTAQGVLQEKTATASSAGPPDAGGASKRPWDFGGPVPVSVSGAPVAAPPPAPAGPPAPRELTEKEKMAQALFGGMSASKAPAPAPASARKAAPASAPAPAPVFAPAPAPAQMQAAARAPAPAPKNAMDDLLGIFDSPSPAPAPSPAAGLDDLFGGGGMRTTFPAPAADPFGGAFGGMTLGGVAAQMDINTLPVPPQFAAVLGTAGSVREPGSGNTRCGGDANVVIACHKVLALEQMHIVFFVANQGSLPMATAQISIAPPTFLRATLQGGSPSGPLSVSLGTIAPRTSSCILATMALAAVPQSGQLRGTFVYGGGQAPLTFTLEIPVMDMLRPAPIDTPSFGGIWTQPAMSAEAVASIPGSTVRTPAEFMSRAVNTLKMHPVQAIAATSEAIAAARVMGLPTVYALLHARIQPAGLEVRIKTADASFTQAIVAVASARLK